MTSPNIPGDNTREVRYKVVLDGASLARAAAEELATRKALDEANSNSTRSAVANAKAVEDAVKKQDSTQQGMSKSLLRDLRAQVVAINEKAAQEKKAADQAEKDATRAADAAEREAKRASAAVEREANKSVAAQAVASQKALDQAARDANRYIDTKISQYAKAADASDRELARAVRNSDSAFQAAQNAARKTADAQVREAQRASAEAQKEADKFTKSFQKSVSSGDFGSIVRDSVQVFSAALRKTGEDAEGSERKLSRFKDTAELTGRALSNAAGGNNRSIFGAAITAGIDVARAKLSDFGDLLGTLPRKLGITRSAIAAVAAGITILGAAGAATAALGSLGGVALAAANSLMALGSAAFALPGLLAAAATGVGALALAFGPVISTFKAYFSTLAGAGSSAKQSADQQTAAADSIRSAQRGVTSATEEYAAAQYDAAQAQKALTQAREDATRSLEDLHTQVARAGLDEEKATIAVTEAQQNYDSVMASSTSTALDKEKATVDLKDAQNDLADVQLRNKRNQEDLNDAEKKGVEGSDQVVAAKHSVDQANQRVTDSQTALTDAIHSLAEAQTKANAAQDVSNAAMEKYQTALNNLSPEQRKFVESMIGMKDQFTALKNTVGDGVFGPINAQMGNLKSLMPTVNLLLGDAAGAIGGIIAKGIQMVSSGPWKADFATISKNNVTILNSMGDAGLSVADAFRNIMVAAGPFTNDLAAGIAKIADGFDRWSVTVRGDGSLARFLADAEKKGKVLIDIFKNLGDAVFHVVNAAGPFTDWLLGKLDDLSKKWDTVAKAQENPNSRLKKWLEDIKPLLTAVGGLIGGIVKIFTDEATDKGNIDHATELLNTLKTDILPKVKQLLDDLSKTGIDKTVIDLFGKLLDLIDALTKGGGGGFKTFIDTLDKFAGFMVTLAKNPAGAEVLKTVGTALGTIAAITVIGKFTGFFKIMDAVKWLIANKDAMGVSVLDKLLGTGAGAEGAAATVEGKLSAAAAALDRSAAALSESALALKGTGVGGAAAGAGAAATEGGAAAGVAGKTIIGKTGLAAGASALTSIPGIAALVIGGTEIKDSATRSGSAKAGDLFNGDKQFAEDLLPGKDGKTNFGKLPGDAFKGVTQQSAVGVGAFEIGRFFRSQTASDTGDAIAKQWSKTYEQFMQRYGSPVSHWFTVSLPEAYSNIEEGIPQTWSHVYEGFMKGFGSPVAHWFTVSLPEAYSNVEEGIPQTWSHAYEGFFKYFASPISDFFSNTVPHWYDNIRDAVSGVWSGVYESFFNDFASPISSFFSNTVPHWYDNIRGAVSSVWSGIYESFFNDFASPISSFFSNTIPHWWDNLKEWAKGVWNGVKDTVNDAIFGPDGLITKVQNGMDTIAAIPGNAWTVIWNGLKAGWNTIKNTLGDFFTGKDGLVNKVQDGINQIINIPGNAWTVIWNGLKTGWNTIKDTLGDFFTGKDGIVAKVQNGIDTVIGIPRNGWNVIWDNLKTGWNTIKTEIGTALVGKDGLVEKVQNGIDTIIGIPRNGWNIIWDNLKTGWNSIKTELHDAFWGKDGLVAKVQDGANTLIDIPRNTWNIIRSDASTMWATIISDIGVQWAKLGDTIASPIKWTIDNVWNNGLVAAWNLIATKFGATALSPIQFNPGSSAGSAGTATAGTFSGGGTAPASKGGKNTAKATGGILDGYSPGIDNHRFYSPTGGTLDLSGGEAVMRPEFTSAVGPNWIHGANAAARGGGVAGVKNYLGGFDGGGIIGAIGNLWGSALHKGEDLVRGALSAGLGALLSPVRALTGAIPGQGFSKEVVAGKDSNSGLVNQSLNAIMDWAKRDDTANAAVAGGIGLGTSAEDSVQAILAVAKKFDPGAVVSSGTRPGFTGPTGGQDYHNVGLAADLIGNMDAIAKGFYGIYPDLLEEIHAPSWFVKNGKKVGPEFYGAATVAQHFDHVHVAARKDAMEAVIKGGGAQTAAPPGSVRDWIIQGLSLVGQQTNQAWINGLYTIAMRESAGDPHAQNNTDSNAQAGHPSKGLLQFIDSTFATWSIPGHKDIWNPIDQVVADWGYINAKYGGIQNVQQANPNLPPMGYSSGGILSGRGLSGTDSHLYLGTPGEGIINPSGMKAIGPGGLAAINSGQAMKMANGGVVLPDFSFGDRIDATGFTGVKTTNHSGNSDGTGKAGTTININQEIHPSPGMDEKDIAYHANRRLATAVISGTSSLVTPTINR